MISGIVRRVESLGETEVSSDVIGEIVVLHQSIKIFVRQKILKSS